MWIPSRGFYGQYLYGRNFTSLSERSEALGEALCVIYGIADETRSRVVIEKTPVTEFGITCIFPQTPGIPPYHNDAIWPFVESYWAWASAIAHNLRSVTCAVSSVYRAAAFFLTNKENMVAGTGDFMGTQINSSRQLWSVAGNLAIVYRVLFGMKFYSDSLQFSPCVPAAFTGTKDLTNLRYRNSILNVTVEGTGDEVDYMTLDDVRIGGRSIPSTLHGSHRVFIRMSSGPVVEGNVDMEKDSFAPGTPAVRVEGDSIKWTAVEGAASYEVYRNGVKLANVRDSSFAVNENHGYSEYQVLSLSPGGTGSFLSEPAVFDSMAICVQGENKFASADTDYHGFTGRGYINLSGKGRDSLVYNVECPDSGLYSIDFRYANGNGPINTDNKCAIRTLKIDGRNAGIVVMPQRGEGNWQDWGYSNPVHVRMSRGRHTFVLYFDRHDNNMNGSVNSALLDSFRMIMISK